MNRRHRLAIFAIGIAGWMALQVAAIHNLPPWGGYRGPYGDVIARAAVYERHANDVVNAITYDYRGVDTLGEEFILFSAVIGVMMLLREENQDAGHPVRGDAEPLSDTVRTFAGPAIGATLLFGIYLAVHGQLSPGGGFQGGVIAAGAPMLVYLARGTQAFRRIAPVAAVECAEALGAATYVVVGFIALLYAAPYLTNVLPRGHTGDVFSSGTIAVISFGVGIEVSAGFVLLITIYLREIMGTEEGGHAGGQ